MTVLVLYVLAVLALAIGAAAIYMAMLEPFPLRWLYWHYFVRKPLVWTILLGSAGWVGWTTWQGGGFPLWSIGPLLLMVLAVVLAYRMHQESVFRALDFPPMAEDPLVLPLKDDAEMAVVEHGGVTKAYSLDHVIQATFESVIGKLHPHTLTMLPFQQLSWRQVKSLDPMPLVARVTEHDLREFELPVPGAWRRIMASEATPGLSARNRDRTLPARTRVVGLIEPSTGESRAWIKSELLERGLLEVEPDIALVAVDGTVNGFRSHELGKPLRLKLRSDHQLGEADGPGRWDLRGKALVGDVPDLTPVALSDEYWFSWKRFHRDTVLVRL